MTYSFRFSLYRRPFKTPLKTAHGTWSVREGIIVTLTDEAGQLSQGEIAPLPWFGTETLAEAIAHCQSLEGRISQEQIMAIPDSFPTCQFGLESALLGFDSQPDPSWKPQDFCYLLRRSPEIVSEAKQLWQTGIRTFKLKIGLDNAQTEMHLCQSLLAQLPETTKLRLDANGGLSLAQAQQWLTWGECQPQLDFLEQPLPPPQFEQLQQLQKAYKTPISLDESMCQLESLQRIYASGWRGIFVIKVAIAGFPSRLIDFCQTHRLDCVCSTVFETGIGHRALLRVAKQINSPGRALGMGGNQWFESAKKGDSRNTAFNESILNSPE